MNIELLDRPSLVRQPLSSAEALVLAALARAMRPRRPITVSQWADANLHVSTKQGPKAGRWSTDNNPPLREPMDCMGEHHTAREVILKFPIQFGKTSIAIAVLGYVMCEAPAPTMVALPGEVSMSKWIQQKLNPMLEETPAVRAALSSTNSRDGANRREFKDFEGGQLYIEHAGSPARLKSSTVKVLIVDEEDEFAASLSSQDDPGKLLDGRTSAYEGSYKRLRISTPTIKGLSRIDEGFEKSDQRHYHVPCPHCAEMQALKWAGLDWSRGVQDVVYVCEHNGCIIREHHKTDMIRAGSWVAHNPGAKVRGYTINCLYYQFGLGPRWATLVEEWLDAQADHAKLKTFVNDRLAEVWEDPSMRSVKHNAIADRAEPYPLRVAPEGVLAITAGLDTQDNREAVQIVGWGERMQSWVLDYIELPGDPADPAVWASVTELLNRPIAHAWGGTLRVEASCIDAGGHRTEAVKEFVAQRRIARPLAIFGAVPNNAPVLSKGKYQETKGRNKTDRKGGVIHHVGTVGIKHWLYGRLSTDADREQEDRLCHFSDQLDRDYFSGLVGETFDPRKNRFEKRRGARVEPLDTYVYAYAATHHPELRLHRYTKADWEARRARLRAAGLAAGTVAPAAAIAPSVQPEPRAVRPAVQPVRGGIAKDDWSNRL
jgi:phage terminase large subunit GpA-like protein